MPTPFPAHVESSSIWATKNSVGIIGTDGKVYFVNDPIIDDYDKVGQVFVSDDSNLKGAFKIGGSHLLRYALRAWFEFDKFKPSTKKNCLIYDLNKLILLNDINAKIKEFINKHQ